ncbi:hypothetical protein SEVIR_3G273750v4 [Setaria viridis]|uniref:Uncharacterized protein n=1 Tax=Setaria viridis TaxID=4556 RepID=A0A4U6VHY6_SETVI|nr:hypothetical protein SEVIR_3G273750v2 [Setaria viridis]
MPETLAAAALHCRTGRVGPMKLWQRQKTCSDSDEWPLPSQGKVDMARIPRLLAFCFVGFLAWPPVHMRFSLHLGLLLLFSLILSPFSC